MFDRKQYKRESKRIIAQGGAKFLWKVAAYLVIILTISMLVSNLSGMELYRERISEFYTEHYEEMLTAQSHGDVDTITKLGEDLMYNYIAEYPEVSFVSGLFVFILSCMSVIIEGGFEWWCLLNTRHMPNDFRNIFDGFGFPIKLLLLSFVKGFLTIIGFICFIVPGVIIYLAYSQSVHIMFEEPDMGIFECLRTSRHLMRGHKGEFFVLQLSFIGWAILGYFLTSYIASMFTLLSLGILAAYASILVDIWLNPYMGLTNAGFFNYITNYQPEQQPVQEEEK